MPESEDGSLERTDDGYVIRFERRYASPVDEVWSALTTPERLQQWIGAAEIELELVAGGRLITRMSASPAAVEGAAVETQDTVLRVEPPRVFEHTFGGSPASVVRWELAADGAGCVVRLTHSEKTDTTGESTASFLAGWHDLLDTLGELLEGKRDISTASMERWQAYKERYEAKLATD